MVSRTKRKPVDKCFREKISFWTWLHKSFHNSVQFSCSVMSNSLWPHEPQNHVNPNFGSFKAFIVCLKVSGSISGAINYYHTNKYSVQFSCSVMSDSVTLCTSACQASLSITNSWSLLKLMSIELVILSNHLILCHRLLLLPSIFPSIRVFSNKSVLHIRWPEYWSFSFNISLFNQY